MNQPYVTRYVVTCLGRDGVRQLADPMQGRWTYATREEAQARIEALVANNHPERITGTMGTKLEVRECDCYPGHFDPVGIYFED